VNDEAKLLAGHVAVFPGQVTAGSQVGSVPVPRQTVPLLKRAMHAPVPLQLSGASQSRLLEEPQLAPFEANASTGHGALAPSHSSAGSHVGLAPAVRHDVPVAFTRATHAPAPSQLSAASQAVALAEPQAVVIGATALAGHDTEDPVQNSAGSHVEFVPAARHCTLLAFN